MKRVLVLIAATVALSASTLASSAAAASGPSPGTGSTGACNMLIAGAGMTNAMTSDNPQGNAGMYQAVAVSGC